MSKEQKMAESLSDDELLLSLSYRRSVKQIGAAQKRWMAALEAEEAKRGLS